jgi:hypothetical protein
MVLQSCAAHGHVVRGVMISLCKMAEDRELNGGCTSGSKT